MGLFKKKKEVEFYETETSLPSFGIDTNGFIMFDDRRLGGAAVMEVIPHVTTEGMTHTDPVYSNESTDITENPGYEPSIALFPDARSQVYPGWVYFLNGLLPLGPEDECTHIQILAKKCRTREWNTKSDYACYKAHKEMDWKISSGLSRGEMKAARARDYLELLDSIRADVEKIPAYTFDVKKLPAYVVRYFLVISYTPSGEGWWMDGRDSDYYVRDSASPLSLFKNDRAVDNAVSLLTRFRKDDAERDDGAEDDLFWIESDRTAQILDTRLKKVNRLVESWNKREPARPMPFHLKPMDGREVAALICFFPNIITPYWDKIWNLHANQDDVLFRADALHALDMHDTSFIEEVRDINKSIVSGEVDMRHTKAEQEEFLAKYRGVAYEDISGLRSERDQLNWTPEEEERRMIAEQQRQQRALDDQDLWGDIAAGDGIAEEFQTPEQRRETFLKKYKNRSTSSMSDNSQTPSLFGD